jgi:hypothetical protein
MKPLATSSYIRLPFLSLARDQRNNLNKIIGNQIPMKMAYQQRAVQGRGGQGRHTCLLSGKGRGTSQDGLVTRYTFRRLLRFGTWPGIYKGK